MQTYYAPVGKSVDRQLGIDKNELMGEQTYNDPENHVEGFLNDAYIDRGYTIRPLGQLRPENTTRRIGHEFTLNKADSSTSKPAGVYEEHKEHITDILAKNYGEDPHDYDYANKCCKNTRNETSTANGVKSLINEPKPEFISAEREGGDLGYYTRKNEYYVLQ